MAYRAMGSVGRDRGNIDRWFCGSYRDYIPDHYELGYQICSYAWERYGEEHLGQGRLVRFAQPFVLATTRVALEKYYETNVHKALPRNLRRTGAFLEFAAETGDNAARPVAALPEAELYDLPVAAAAGRYGDRGPEKLTSTACRVSFASTAVRAGSGRIRPTGWSRRARRCATAASGGPSTVVRRFFEQRVNSQLCWLDLADGRPGR